MTSEIVVMNREGVALAADSVITYRGSKMFNTANKLFMLAPTYPVGILIYNSAGFMDLPWEIIIKAYRDKILQSKVRYERLEDYANNFIQFIIDERESFVTSEQQNKLVFSNVDILFREVNQTIFQKIDSWFLKSARKIPESKIFEFTKDTIEDFSTEISRLAYAISEDEIEEFKEKFFENFGEIIERLKSIYFDPLPIDATTKKSLL